MNVGVPDVSGEEKRVRMLPSSNLTLVGDAYGLLFQIDPSDTKHVHLEDRTSDEYTPLSWSTQCAMAYPFHVHRLQCRCLLINIVKML